MPPEYSFVSWLRQGAAAEITAVDRLGANPDMGPDGRATLPVELTLDHVARAQAPATARATIHRDVSLLGPGDVAAIKGEAIIRSRPAQGARGVTPGEFAHVEFYDEDFPWRYTPARADGARLRPWLGLLVLTPDEFTVREPARSGALPVLRYGAGVRLPPRMETWAWAHVQITGVVAAPAAVDGAIRARPDHALSRLLSPRRLLPTTEYHAFLVPAFETGRLAGLGRSTTDVPTQKPAWGASSHADDRELPIYHRFSFATGTSGDFETLARKLTPGPVGDEFGKRPLDISAPGFGMQLRSGATTQLEGALAPPNLTRTDFPDSPGTATASELRAVVDLGEEQRTGSAPDDPLVAPPAYGRWHAEIARLADASHFAELAWLGELNLDPRSRAAAGLGAEVVRERQEELMQRAWEQVGAVEAANQRLREAELARGIADSLLRKHVAQAGGEDRILLLTSSTHAGLPVPQAGATASIRGAVDASRVPAAAASPTFRRITRPQRPLMKRLTGDTDNVAFQSGLLTQMNAAPGTALSAAPPAPPPAAGVELASVSSAVAASVTELQDKQLAPNRLFIEFAQLDLRTRLDANGNLVVPGLPALRTALNTRVDARFPAGSGAQNLALANRVKALIAGITTVAPDGPGAARITLSSAAFIAEYGRVVAGKAGAGVTVLNASPPPGGEISNVAALGDVQAYAASLGAFATGLGQITEPPAPAALTAPATLAGHVLSVLAPVRALGDRLAGALPVISERPPTDPRRLSPVMAHPEFRDPLFESLRALSQDHIIPNVADLPRDSLTLMEPNTRFIESFMAGANHAFAQELLWREYPTDRRGTYFKAFWDTRDALDAGRRDDIAPLHEWAGGLGAQAPLPTGVLVLVIRGELLEKYPSTVIYAQEARWPGTDTLAPRVLDPAGEVRHPIFHGRLEPDITIVGFDLPEELARGHRPLPGDSRPARPGWFFVLMERPGEPRFGLDDATPPTGFRTWNDLAWDRLRFPEGTPYVEIEANEPLAPSTPQTAVWGRSAADMASALFQSPVLLARHASEMLP